ncbi:MAG: hypothetical protein QHI48_07990 [Bacteroidota bacterium]|nr:hypothetical protein [Bacteroidota bacterium]
MKRILPYTLAILFAAVAVSRPAQAQQEKVSAKLLPERVYTVLIKKSYAGNDGFREIVPQVSEQTVRIETEKAGASGMPAVLIAERPRRVDEKTGRLGERRREWEIHFTVKPDGDIGDISAASSDDGEAPEPLAKSVLLSHLDAVLFLSGYPIDRKGKPRTIVTSSRDDGNGFVVVEYRLEDESGLERYPGAGEGTVTTAGGTALFSRADEFFTSRRHESVTTVHLIDNATGESRTVTMSETTLTETTIAKK